MRTHIFPSAVLLASVVLLSACSVGPTFVPPEPVHPDQWNATAATATQTKSLPVAESVDRQWWKLFSDPTLNELITRAQSANLDLRITALRLAQSREQRHAVAGNRLPTINASASYQRQRQSEVGVNTRMIDVIGPPGNRDAIIDALAEPFDVYQAGFDASWELDLWGRVRHSVESADASVAAGIEELHDAQLTLMAEVARNYVELRGMQDQLRIAVDDVAAGEDLLKLTEYRAAGGLVTDLDVQRQRGRLAEARARVPQLQQQESQIINSLALLLGEQPGVLQGQLSSAAAVPAVPPKIAIGVPSEVARRRPDIRRAEARLHAATADIGVAVADLYPRITLTGSFVQQSLANSDLSDWGARQWVVGPSLQLPIFDGARRRATVELRKLQQQEAAIAYQRTVLRAWHEIDNALTAYSAEQTRNDELAQSVSASRAAYDLANTRYEHGLTDFLIALDAQRTLLQAQRAYSDSTTTISTQLVALYKALGGGWND
jgi:NodT family efflux transporter outer membrane factor (OMF) lipoprotein